MSGSNEVRVVNEKTGGMKGSKDEAMSLLPWEQLKEVARLYNFGAEKYDRSNWMLGYDWHLSYDSLIRHAASWWEGEFDDEESGCDHMTSVVFHALALMYFRKHHPDLDDRPGTVLAARQAATTPDEHSEAPSGPEDGAGGAIRAVFRHVEGPGIRNSDGELLTVYFVRTGMEAPAGYRFSHIEPDIDTPPSLTFQRIAHAALEQERRDHEVTYGREIVHKPAVSRRIDRMADGTPVPQAIDDAPLEDYCPCLRGAGCDGSCGASRP